MAQYAPGAAIDPAVLAAVDAAQGTGTAGLGATGGEAARTTGQASPYSNGQTQTGYNPQAAAAAADLAAQAAQQAYLNARLREVEIPSMRMLDERERERIRQEAARDAWQRTYQQALLSGKVPTAPGASLNERASAAWEKLPPEQRTPQGAAGIWQALVPGLSAEEAAALHGAVSTHTARTGAAAPDDLISEHLQQITGGRINKPPLTIDAQRMQNDTTLGLLRIGADLRGPGDWAKYMQTVAAIPPEMRNLVSQVAGRFQMPGGAPGAASVAGMAQQMGTPAAAPAAGAVQTAQPAATMPLGTVAREPAAAPMVAGPNGVATHQGIASTINGPIPGAPPGGVPPPKLGVQPPDPSAPGTENATMNAMIRSSAGVQPEFRTAMQPRYQPVTAAPAAAPARFLTGNQLPRSFLGAGADAQDFVLGGAEAAGESRRQILHEFEQSMPKYQGARRGRVKV